MIYVLGAPGSGKTTVAPLLSSRLPTHTVIDWDAFIDAASDLAGRDVRRSPETWPSYTKLVRAIVDSIRPRPIIVLGGCSPSELRDWPIDAWVLLDCADAERERRLGAHRARDEVTDAVSDGRHYRGLGLRVIDTTDRSSAQVAAALADLVPHIDISC